MATMTMTTHIPRRSSIRLRDKECSALLRLPREIRDLIYMYLLTTEQEPPEDSIQVDKANTIQEDQGDGSIYYERPLPTIACQGLLATCRQIHHETIEAINSCNGVPSTALKYKLNLIIWDENLRPTWLWLPAPPRYVKHVEVDMKCLDHLHSQPVAARLRHSHILAQYLLQMLRRFFENGPRMVKPALKARNDCNRKAPPFVEKLIINLVSLPSYWTKEKGEFVVRDSELEQLEEGTRRFLKNYLHDIIRRGSLLGKVGTLELRYGGEVVCVWDDMAPIPFGGSISRLHPYGWGPVLQRTQDLVDKGRLKWNKLLDCERPSGRKRTAEEIATPPERRRKRRRRRT